jgi:putative DNA methylase
VTTKKKLIEVALPLEAINRESAAEKKNPFLKGHPRGLHHWWARRPLAACRAVLFAQLVDDPSSHPEEFPTSTEQEQERLRLFDVLERLIRWENRNSEDVLQEARAEILKSCGGHPPAILDPFAGGGSIPLEAQRLGLVALAGDLNPVAVLINRAQIEFPVRWAGREPVNPSTGERFAFGQSRRAQGLASDVSYYGNWMNEKARETLLNHFPSVRLVDGSTGTVKAWIWARTVTCPNPACRQSAPLARSFWLCKRKGAETWVEAETRKNGVRFSVVRSGGGPTIDGTVNRSGAVCLFCGQPIPFSHIRTEGQRHALGTQLMATVVQGARRRVYVSPEREQEDAANVARSGYLADTELFDWPGRINVVRYGILKHGDLFTSRQLLVMSTLSALVSDARSEVERDAGRAGLAKNEAKEYSNDVATYLGMAVSRLAAYENSACIWHQTSEIVIHVYSRQSIAMTWDFVETNPFGAGLDFMSAVGWVTDPLATLPPPSSQVGIVAAAAAQQTSSEWASHGQVVVATDPPYYDNIPYSDVADLFYVWLRASLREIVPGLFDTLLTPKADELVANPYRLGGKAKAERFFEEGLFRAFANMRVLQAEDYPLTIFYAFKQAEGDSRDGAVASTGWETMLEGLLRAGFMITATWPMRTELETALKKSMSVLASSIVLTCRSRTDDAPVTDRRALLRALRSELPLALSNLQQAMIAPVDLAQAAIGPGMAVFSRYSKVVEADGSSMSVRTALGLINQVLDETLAEQEGDFDAETRWVVAWFEQNGLNQGPFGVAETLSKAKNTSIDGLVRAGLLESKAGKVRLLERWELDDDWDPTSDARLTVWEVTQYLPGAEFGSQRRVRSREVIAPGWRPW